ncbi:MAG: L,D-transpeptidase family protein [Flavobacteriales bacterium]|nr:L,D-transpeptidase family protein [Flavobacteriales bacterium]
MIIEIFIFIISILVSLNSFAQHNFQSRVIGEILIHNVAEEETLYDIARDYDVGIEELIYANLSVNPWLPGVGVPITLPTMHILPHAKCEGIIINKAELRLYYFTNHSMHCDPKYILTFPISIGGAQHSTPIGTTYITKKKKNPFWIPPASIKAKKPYLPKLVLSGDSNPLGQYAIYLGWPQILIHGTNKPWGIGTHNTHGCISMYPEDIKILFEKVKIGTMVKVIDQQIKTAWHKNKLYIELSPTQEQKLQLDSSGKVKKSSYTDKIKDRILNQYKNVHKLKLNSAIQRFQGMPIELN